MAITDILSGTVKAEINIDLARTGGHGHTGVDKLYETSVLTLTDGDGSNEATGFFSEQFAMATSGGTTISMGEATTPISGGSQNPTEDPDGKDLRAILIENLDDAEYITVTTGTNALVGWLTATDEIRIPAGGCLLATFPADEVTLDATGSKDEIKITAESGTCETQVSYVFG